MSRSTPLWHSGTSATASDAAVAALLEHGGRRLNEQCGAAARREARFLLAGVLEINPGRLWLESDRRVSQPDRQEYTHRLERRAHGEPLQYVEGRAAFRELWLQVDRAVMIPRPETEVLVGSVLEWSRGRHCLRAVDIGTGSGAIALSLALEGPFEHVVGVDISPEALKVAGENVAETALESRIELRCGSFFDALRPGERFHVVVANPPYIARVETDLLPAEVREWEPREALYAGATGLEALTRLVDEAPEFLEPEGLLALEVAPHQVERTAACICARTVYNEPRVIFDNAGRARVVLAELIE